MNRNSANRILFENEGSKRITALSVEMSQGPTKLVLFEIGGNGRQPSVTRVAKPGADTLTTRDVPMPLVRNLMALHESAAPGSVKGFAKSVYRFGLMEELLSDVIVPKSVMSSPRSRIDMKNPESVMEAFYAASFLQNEEARECLVYSQEGKVVGMAQVGKFGADVEGLQCTISNLLVSPKIDASTQSAVVRHVAETASAQFGEATLLTPEPWGSAYETHGFAVESAGPPLKTDIEEAEALAAQRDPVSVSIIREAGSAIPVLRKPKQHVVRCRWSA